MFCMEEAVLELIHMVVVEAVEEMGMGMGMGTATGMATETAITAMNPWALRVRSRTPDTIQFQP
jgi:hypothetical protein